MELRRYFEIILRWLWLILIGAFLAGGIAFLVSGQQPRIYQASTTLLINQASNPVQTSMTDLMMSERLASTYRELLRKRPLLEATLAELGLAAEPDALAKRVSVSAVRDTQLLVLNVQDTDPVRAAALANKLPEIFVRMDQETRLGRLAVAKQSLAAQIQDLEAKIAATETRLTDMGVPIDEYDKLEMSRLQDTLARYRSTWTTLLQSMQEIELTEARAVDNVIIVEPAVVPDAPISPKTMQNTLLATLVGVMIGLGVVFLIEYLDDTLKTGDDVQESLGLSTIGVIDRIQLNGDDSPLITTRQTRAAATEAFRVLRANIQFLGVDQPVRNILVTSAGPSEGKSMITANLGVVMAQSGLSVIVVDADLRRPTMHRAFSISRDRGLTNALMRPEGGAALETFLQPTQVENLRVLPSGPLPPNPADLLGSRRMSELIQTLSHQVDVILIDSPPILAAADASMLAARADGVLLVIESGVTSRAVVAQAKETLEKAGARILGVTLNKLSRRVGSYYYRYYYYYGHYGNNGDDGGKRKKRKVAGHGSHAPQPAPAGRHDPEGR